jgi:CRP/FNR family transcriptional regulator
MDAARLEFRGNYFDHVASSFGLPLLVDPAATAALRDAHLAEVAALGSPRGLWLDVEVHLACGRKPWSRPIAPAPRSDLRLIFIFRSNLGYKHIETCVRRACLPRSQPMPRNLSSVARDTAAEFPACRCCRAAPLCRASADAQAGSLIRRRRLLRRGDLLYRAGDPNDFLYAVCCGAVKTCALTRDGLLRTDGFYLPGELLGLDGSGRARHGGEAVALEYPTQVCEILNRRLRQAGEETPGLRPTWLRLLDEQVAHEQSLLGVFIGRRSAAQRLAAFLLGLAERRTQRGLPADEFPFSLSHADLADYLGLAKETVCRLFARFHRQGLIGRRARCLRITAPERLRALACGD